MRKSILFALFGACFSSAVGIWIINLDPENPLTVAIACINCPFAIANLFNAIRLWRKYGFAVEEKGNET